MKTGIFTITIYQQNILPWLCAVLVALSCSKPGNTLFTKMPASETGIDFRNINIDTDTLSIIDYLYYYNGGGIAVGDINNDGLPDIYFTSNTNGNKLYLNKGNFKFQDITLPAGVTGKTDWTSGTTMVDINGDGYLDIYISTVSHHDPYVNGETSKTYFNNARNLLFINNGNNTFTESATQWGVALQGYNTQAAFFDYDLDGDLDLFQLQHSTHQPDAYGPATLRGKYSNASGGKLLRHDGDHFTDVTREAGIISSALGYGLGVAVADFNHDGYDDIYVGNDFHENDYYYVNQGNGTFQEMNETAFGHESKSSMGNDAADINNDGWLDIMTLDMLPEEEKIIKSTLGDDEPLTYQHQRKFGYHHQYSRNCLQLNIGQGKKFSDIALYSGVAATDWSWSALIADYDMDGIQDLFVTNGVKKRPNDLDFIKFISTLPKKRTKNNLRENDKEIMERQPAGATHNYIFKGTSDLVFRDSSVSWGFEEANLSQGAVYADLDGDGDLDIITNNMNEPAGIYRNNIKQFNPSLHSLNITLKGNAQNTFGIGTKVFLFSAGKIQFRQMQPSRGFVSSVEPILHFGLGETDKIDSIVVLWPNNAMCRFLNIKTDQRLHIDYNECGSIPLNNQLDYINTLLHTNQHNYFTDITDEAGIPFLHREDLSFVDFDRQWYIPHALSTQGPKIAVADVNKDGLEDFYICGAKSQPGVIYLQQTNARFLKSKDTLVFIKDRECEDVDAIFFDANGDQYPDLYATSGGNEYSGNTPLIADRLYINDKKGNFTKSASFPALYENKSVVCIADYDKDGDIDIFAGGRADARSYGVPPTSYLLENDGKGNFSVVTDQVAPSLTHIGMVTGAVWTDADKDGWPDLVIVGEWMAPTILKNQKGKLADPKPLIANRDMRGWWTCITTSDINNDGSEDLLLGNYGLNSKLQATLLSPLTMQLTDIAGNGRNVQILSLNKQGKHYPFLGKDDLEKQLPYLKTEYPAYSEMAGKTTEDIFKGRLNNATLFEATDLASTTLLNNGKGVYTVAPLPFSMQWSPVFAFAPGDYNKDGIIDIVTGGNFYGTLPHEGRYDAMALQLCLGNGKASFNTQLPIENSLRNITGEVRDIQSIQLVDGNSGLLIAINNSNVRLLKINEENTGSSKRKADFHLNK